MRRSSSCALAFLLCGIASIPVRAEDSRRVTMQPLESLNTRPANSSIGSDNFLKITGFHAALEDKSSNESETGAYFEPPLVGDADGSFKALIMEAAVTPESENRKVTLFTPGQSAPELEIASPQAFVPVAATEFQAVALGTPEEIEPPSRIVEIPVEKSIFDALPQPPKPAALAVIEEEQRRASAGPSNQRAHKSAREMAPTVLSRPPLTVHAPLPTKVARPVLRSTAFARPSAAPSSPKMGPNEIAAVRAFTRF